MTTLHSDQFLGLPLCDEQDADAVIVPLPYEKTVSYGTGTGGGPHAIVEASLQLEVFDEETLIDFSERPRIYTVPPLAIEAAPTDYLVAAKDYLAVWRDRFVLAVGGEHIVTYGVVDGLVEDLSDLTIVQIDAHADLADKLEGQKWSHGTVMRRLWERGCRLVQIGVRSLSRPEYDLAANDDRITTYYAHRLAEQWEAVLRSIGQLRGQVYLTIDVDGLDPAVIPSTGTPQPDGLSWRQTMEVVRAVASVPECHFVGADVVEYVPSPHPPGCDPIAAKLVAKVLAFWETSRRRSG